MDVDVARTFLEVVKAGSFVNAAANLHLTQTAVSARIRVLEAQLKRPVFVRGKTGVRLTPAGEQFLRFATTLVQVWERARSAVALPPGRETVVTIGAELSLWDPMLRRWLVWMRGQCPEYAIKARIGSAGHLVEQVQDGLLDVAVLYDAPHRPGLVSELLFEEKLVFIRTLDPPCLSEEDGYVQIDWGEEFGAGVRAAFPERPNPQVEIGYGPLAFDYLLKVGGSGYFREGFVRPYLRQGLIEPVPGSPEFPYSAYMIHSSRAEEGVMSRMRSGLRASVAAVGLE